MKKVYFGDIDVSVFALYIGYKSDNNSIVLMCNPFIKMLVKVLHVPTIILIEEYENVTVTDYVGVSSWKIVEKEEIEGHVWYRYELICSSLETKLCYHEMDSLSEIENF